jgi:speckle-type POZ protein
MKTGSSNLDYPVLVTALLDGLAIEMKQPSPGQWNEAKWTYSRPQEYDSYHGARNRSARLTLILQFPQIVESLLVGQYSNLLESQTMADVKFIIRDKEFAAHAAILASASPVMAAMFEPGKFKEGQSRTVEITDIEPEVFQQMLRYVYTGNAPLMQKDSIAEQLLIAANKYQMDKMKAECEDTLIWNLTLNNAIKFLVTAHLYLAPNLKEASIQCLTTHRFVVWDRPEWDRLNKSYNDLFIEACRRMYKDKL